MPPTPAAPIETADEAGGGSIGLGLAISFFFQGLLLGLLLGARTRQLATAVKDLPRALASLQELMFKRQAEEQHDDGAAEEVADNDGDGTDEPASILERFLSTEHAYGLDDHIDVERNPIIMCGAM